MAKFSRIQKLTPQEQEKLLIEFCGALVEVKTAEEAAQFIKDLLSKQEAQMLAKRIAIARLLIQGKNYAAIRSSLRVSEGTIARINHWLAASGEGYRLVVTRVKPQEEEKAERQERIEEISKPYSWKNFKRKYPLYFWPDLLVEEIVKSASKKHKEKLRGILSKFSDKEELFDDLNVFLRDEYGKRKKVTLRKNSNTTKY